MTDPAMDWLMRKRIWEAAAEREQEEVNNFWVGMFWGLVITAVALGVACWIRWGGM